MKIEEFNQLRQVLHPFYHREEPPVVGYLRGSVSAGVWRSMHEKGRTQMLILGNRAPTREQWEAAGVGHRLGDTREVKFPDLQGFIILFGGFMVDRPWGKICAATQDASELGFPGALRDFKRHVNHYLERQR